MLPVPHPLPAGERAAANPPGVAARPTGAVVEAAQNVLDGEAQWRPCRLEPEGFKQVADWVEEYRRIWEASFDRLDDSLKRVQREKRQKRGQ